jgi:hypothetical protein
MADVVRDIQHVGETYQQLEYVPERSVKGTFLYRADVMQAGVITPLLLQLFSASEQQLSPARMERCIKALESYLIRRMICRMTTKGYNRLVLDLITRIDKNIQTADDILINYLLEQESESRVWPSDDQVKKAVIDLPLYRLLTRGRVRLVLEAIEESMRTKKAEEPYVVRESLTIEHIMPQSWREHWPITDEDDPEKYLERVNERERLLHTLGNLTLITNRLNPALSNGPWEKKQEGLQEHSTLFLNKTLLSKWGKAPFSESEIKERGQELAKTICSIWPI